MLTATEIRSFARRIGVHAIGWFAASDFDHYLATLRERETYHHTCGRRSESRE